MSRRHITVICECGKVISVNDIPDNIEVDVIDYSPRRPAEPFERRKMNNGMKCWFARWFGHPRTVADDQVRLHYGKGAAA